MSKEPPAVASWTGEGREYESVRRREKLLEPEIDVA
jgi:hypothetical protein